METAFTFENLANAARQCLNGVQWKNSTALWRRNLIGNCKRLEAEIASGKYKMSPQTTFEITRPKRRLVTSMKFRDRVVHKVICHEGGLTEDLFRNAFFDNTACQKGKGTDFARQRLITHLRKHYAKHGCTGYILNLDIHHFFQCIPHDRLIAFVYRKVRNPQVRSMVADFIQSCGENGVGLDLGSEVSQLLANSYLTAVDYVVKQRCGVIGYVRYADNMVMLLPTEHKEFVECILHQVKYSLGTLGLELNPKSSVIPIRQGVNFLGFRFKLTQSGRVIMQLMPHNMKNARRHFKRLAHLEEQGKIDHSALREAFISWAAHASKANVSNSVFVNKINQEVQA